jgi:hypothetical protein
MYKNEVKLKYLQFCLAIEEKSFYIKFFFYIFLYISDMY